MIWRHLRAILLLPFVATVVVPVFLMASPAGGRLALGPGARAATVVLALPLLAAGLALFVATVRLFARQGEGTLAPWDPTRKLVVEGPYRYVRNPMITGVAFVLLGEALLLAAPALGLWFVVFSAVNAVYIPRAEEPGLVKRFGAEYERYRAHVPRWIPRRRPWRPEDG